MCSSRVGLLATILTAGTFAGAASAQVATPALTVKAARAGAVEPVRTFTPDSSVQKPADLGLRYHTHYGVVLPPTTGLQPFNRNSTPAAVGSPPFSGYYAETPASLACIYGLVTKSNGCQPDKLTAYAPGGANAIALIDAYHFPTAAADLQRYSTQFGLPAPNITVVYAKGTQPAVNSDWNLEAALDIEMAHAMAPSAKIYLVEAASNSNADLDQAVDVAFQLLNTNYGGGMISMSYGGAEYSGNTSEEVHFNKSSSHIEFFASTGDAPGVNYPSTSPNVVAVGGTATSRNLTTLPMGDFTEETAWPLAGAGLSAYFARPAYQNAVASRFGGRNLRAVPDVAAIASDQTNVWVYCGASCSGGAGWYRVYGTSVASPLMAGLANRSGKFRVSSVTLLTNMYNQIGTAGFFDVGRGVCGPNAAFFTYTGTAANKAGFDLCTGLGAPRGGSVF